MDECHHEKVYSSNVLLSNPPIYPWICRKCGVQGSDRGQFVQYDEYDQLIRQKAEQQQGK